MGETGIALSVVVATYNRQRLLERLLLQLAEQTLPADQFEVIVVDDGSREPVALEKLRVPYALRVHRQENAGAAAARHAGLLLARGRVALITDDDMQVPKEFLAAHLRRHAALRPLVLMGEIRPDPDLGAMPLFERLRADQLHRLIKKQQQGKVRLHGNHLCTGNVSFRVDQYRAVGGFDLSLHRSEDAELGLRFERAGLDLVFDSEPYVLHGSDHASLEQWLSSVYRYGCYDQRIADKYPEFPHADPWRYLFTLAVVARPFLGLAVLAPRLMTPAAQGLMGLGDALASVGLERPALRAAGLAYALQYFRALREEAGSLRNAVHRALAWRRKVRAQAPGAVA